MPEMCGIFFICSGVATRGTSIFAMPCYKTTFWRRGMAQVLKIAGDPRPEKLAPAP